MNTEIKRNAEARMQKSVESLQHELSKLRTSRAHAGVLDHVTVEYYGSQVPLSQVAKVVVEDARTLAVTPWEKGLGAKLEKAIRDSDLGLNPVGAGDVIRVPMPMLTEERRRDLAKVVRHEGENGRVAVRNVRRDANGDIKRQVKDKLMSEDEGRRIEEEIQKLTDRFIAEIDKIVAAKETELMDI